MNISSTGETSAIVTEQVRLLYEGAIESILSSAVLAAALVFLQRDVIGLQPVIVWTALFAVTLAWRVLLVILYRHALGGVEMVSDSAQWLARYRAGVVAAAVVWGLASILLFPNQDLVHQTFLAFTLAGLSASAMVALVADHIAAHVFLLAVLAPLAVRLLSEGHEIQFAMGTMVMLYFGFLAVTSRRICRDIVERKQVQIAIAESRNLLLTIIDTAPVRIFWKDRNLRYLGCNEAFAKDTGMTHPQDVIGKDDYQMGWASQAELYRADDRAVMESGIARLSYDEQQTTPSGQAIWLRSSKVPLRNQDSEVFGVLGIYENITERKQAEEKLRQLSAAVEQSPVTIVISDTTGAIEYVNPKFTELTGYNFAEALGQNPRVLKSGETTPEEYQELWNTILSGEVWRGQFHNKKKNGELFWEQACISPIKDVRGVITSFLAVKEDITERKQAEEKLLESEERLSIITSSAHDAIIMLDAIGNITFWNEGAKRMFGYAREEVLGHDLHTMLAPLYYREAHRQAFLHFQQTGQGAAVGRTVELVGLRKDGGEFPLELSLSAVQVKGAWHSIGMVRDISERKQAEEKLHLAASVFTHAWEGIMITDPDGNIIDVNDAFSRITSYSRDEVLGQNPRILNPDRQAKEFALWCSLIEDGQWNGEVWNRRKNGEVYAVLQNIGAVSDAQGNIRHYVVLLTDITSIKKHELELEHIAHYDMLTGLPNRVLLADRLHLGMAQAQRRSRTLAVLAVAFLDLDGFKDVNDKHGHEVGDQLLIAASACMKQSLREGDTFARMGGDEFVAVLLDLADAAASAPMLARLLAAAAQPVQVGDLVLQVSASLGVTFYPQEEDIDADQLLRQADQAMYQAKLAGKNRYHIFDAELDGSIRGHHESLERIRHALAECEFVLHYQPKVNMRTGTVIGTEALIRWQHPEKGLLLPSVFLPVVEDHPLAVELGEWVIDSALAQMELWQRSGLDLPVSVNVGARQLQQADFVGRLCALLAAHPNVRPGQLGLEVLETSALELAGASRIIEACREIGVMFALDDFGTGYSSLTYLKSLPVTQIKIDQSFVRDMLGDPDDLAILDGVISLATAFRRQVIAEGVETVEHGEMLLQLGCEMAQGFGIARPMPAADLPGWITAWHPNPAWINCLPVSRDDLPLLLASAEHIAWILAVESYLKGERKAPPPLDHHQCRFGRWLDAVGLARHGAYPAFLAIEPSHRQVHALAADLCESHARGGDQEALARLGELHGLRDALLGKLKMGISF